MQLRTQNVGHKCRQNQFRKGVLMKGRMDWIKSGRGKSGSHAQHRQMDRERQRTNYGRETEINREDGRPNPLMIMVTSHLPYLSFLAPPSSP